jgi:hypothetical protein
MVIIDKKINSQNGIINIISKLIIRTIYFVKMLWCFYCRKEGHVRNDCLVWKKVIEKEKKNSKPKVGVNVAMVDWDQPIVNVCVTTRG